MHAEGRGWEGTVSVGEGLGRVENPDLSAGTSIVGLGEHGLCLFEQQGAHLQQGGLLPESWRNLNILFLSL